MGTTEESFDGISESKSADERTKNSGAFWKSSRTEILSDGGIADWMKVVSKPFGDALQKTNEVRRGYLRACACHDKIWTHTRQLFTVSLNRHP